MKIETLDDNSEAVLNSVPNGKRRHRRRDTLEFDLRDSQILERIGENDEWADTSTTPTLNDDELEIERPGILSMKENYTPGRTSKAARKQARHSNPLQVVTPLLMDKVHATLHPESRPLEDKSDRPGDGNEAALSHQIIQDNISFNTGCFKPASMRQSVHTKKLLKSSGIGKVPSKVPRNEVEMAAILEKLGVSPVPTRPSKERVALLKQLRNIIRDDIDKVENENRDTMMRMAGYWRYVNRKTYNFMVRHNQIWDWATGQKLEEVEEEDESELDKEVGNEAWDDASTVGTSRSGAGTPQKEVEDNTSDTHFGDTDSSQIILRMEEQDTTSNSTSKAHLSTPRAVESSTRNRRPEGTPERPSSALEKDLRHYEIPATVATHKFEERLPSISPLPTRSTSLPSQPSQPSTRNAFSPPHHDPHNHYDSLESLKGGLNRRLGHTNSIKVLEIPSTGPLVETTNSWATVKRQGSRPGKPTYAAAVKKRTQRPMAYSWTPDTAR